MIGSSACWTTRVGTRTVGSTARTSNSDHERQHESNGPWACRQAFDSGPRCPDLLVPRHVRIDRHAPISPVPHMATMAARTSSAMGPSRAFGRSDPRSPRARRARLCGTDMSRRTAPPSRTRRRREEDRFATPEIVEHRGDAVGPLLQGRQRARRDRIGRSRARLVEEDQPTERCHRLDPPLNGRQLRKDLAACEPVRDEHDVARTFTRRAIGDAQVPVHRIARLREHCGSVSRGAGRVSVSSNGRLQACSGVVMPTPLILRSLASLSRDRRRHYAW